ncbi:MAG: tetratricopeptide repeat protein [Verrucomicrobiota bacterium]|nr:tetratricopeptide repeat protein [Verrucomicrobiota bacterium]
MELTIEQVLQRAVAAHKEGKLQDAESLYRAILQSQPMHPDANHNLGVLAVSVNKTDAALPLFKTALEANPAIEQFWLSYIDALLKENQLDDAKRVLEQAKKQDVGEEKIIALEKQLTAITRISEPKFSGPEKNQPSPPRRKNLSKRKKGRKEKKNQIVNGVSPSEEQLSRLLELYQNGQFYDAEKLAVSITNEFPKHQFAWKVLGAVLQQTGRVTESLTAMRKSVNLALRDAEAHNNLALTLQKLGRLDEALASHRQAIALDADFAEAHNNLGITLRELGKLDEAEAGYKKAIALKPDYPEAHSNLGVALKELGKLDEAEASCKKAIALKHRYAEAHSELGKILLMKGQHRDGLNEIQLGDGFVSFDLKNGVSII